MEDGLARNWATVGPTEMHEKLRWPQGESNFTTGAPTALAKSTAELGFTM